MTIKSPIAGIILALAAWATGCTKLTEERGGDSSTHWLKRCTEHAQCGELRCLCGVCSAGCHDDEACRHLGPAATCETGATACAGMGGMCVAECVHAADCRALRGAACVEGRCVREANDSPALAGDTARTDRGSEAGTGADAAAAVSSVDAATDAHGGELDASALCWWEIGLQGGGRRLVPCASECTFELILSNASPDSCGSLAATLSVQDMDSRSWTVQATFSEQAMARAAQLARALRDAPLSAAAVTCPNCDDRDSAWFTLPGSDQFTVQATYPLGDPPANGVDADELVQSLIDQLRTCEGPLIRDCKRSEPSDPDRRTSDDCMVTFSNADNTRAMSCSFPQSVDAPCRAAAACLCGAEGLPEPMIPTCVDSWLAPRGAITFADLCAPNEASATRTLGQAVRELAGFYSFQSTATSQCEEVRAFY